VYNAKQWAQWAQTVATVRVLFIKTVVFQFKKKLDLRLTFLF